MYSIYNLFKIASSENTRANLLALLLKEATDRLEKLPRERSPEVMERYLRRSLNRNPDNSLIKDLVERFQGATESEQVDIADEISKIDNSIFGSKYPQEDFRQDPYSVMDSLELDKGPHGFYLHPVDDTKNICGYIYGSNALNHIDHGDIDLFGNLLRDYTISNYKDIIKDLKSGNVFYVENLAVTGTCGGSGARLMLELVKKLKNTNFNYIYAEFLQDSYEIIKAAKSTDKFQELGIQLIIDEPNAMDDGDIYSRAKVLIKIK